MSEPAVSVHHLTRRFADETAVNDLSLEVQKGEFVTLLGPSGCGKTTTLRCIAGLERPDAGEIQIDARTVASVDRAIHLHPEQRDIGMVFQSYAVWPHMTVFDNVAYGLRVRRAGRADTVRLATKALERVGMAEYANRYATKLSGGQRQRVALARAIAYAPKVILFDEPLSNLDAKLREQMRIELVRLQRDVGITSVYVTHDQAEALVMSDRVVVMDRGVIQQVGDPRSIYERPVNAFVARFIGVANLLAGRLLERKCSSACIVEVPLGGGLAPLRLAATGGEDIARHARVMVSVRPEDIALHTVRPAFGMEANVVEGRFRDAAYLGRLSECIVVVGANELTVQTDGSLALSRGQTVFLCFRPEHALCLAG